MPRSWKQGPHKRSGNKTRSRQKPCVDCGLNRPTWRMRERLVANCPLVMSGRAVYGLRIAKMLTLGGFMEKP